MGTVNKKFAGVNAFVERNPYISTGARGAAIGAGTFATIAAVKEVLDMIEDRKKKKKAKKPTLSSDTIVITLPDKGDEKLASARDLALEEAKKHTTKPTDGAWRQARNSDGTFASGWELDLYDAAPEEKTAQEKEKYNPGVLQEGLDMGLGGASAVVGAGLGWYLAQQTYDYLKKKRLKREIAAAQKEYIDFLTSEKTASIAGSYDRSIFHRIGDGAIEHGPFDKEGLQNFGKYSTGTVTATAILLALASTYLTKKFLDQKFNDLDTKTTINDVPKVNNIVFKTASAEEIPLTPADALAMVKFAEIMLEADSILMEKEAGLKGWMLDQMMGQPDWIRKSMSGPMREKAMAGLFAGMGMEGDDPSTWTYNGNVDKNNLSAEQLRDLRNVHTLFSEDNDAAMKLFMSDKYKAQRENMARQYLNNWYGNSWLGKTFGTDTGFGQLMQKLLGWFGNYYANSSWGGKNMYNRMMSGINNAASGANEINPYAQYTPEQLAELQRQEFGDVEPGGGDEPAIGFEEPGDTPVQSGDVAAAPAQSSVGDQVAQLVQENGGYQPGDQTQYQRMSGLNPPAASPTPSEYDITDTTNTPEQAMDEYASNPMNYDSRGFMYEEWSPDPEAARRNNEQFAANQPGGSQNNKYSPNGGLAPAASSFPPPPAPPSQGSEPPAPVAANNGVGTPNFGDQPDKYRPNGFRKGAGLLDSKLLAAASRLAVTTDTRNDALDEKLDRILATQQKNVNSSKKKKNNDGDIKIIAADKNAKEVIGDKRKVIEQVLKDLKAQGTI